MRGCPLTESSPDAMALRYNRDDMNSDSPHPANRCHFCAATSYHHLIARDQKFFDSAEMSATATRIR